MKLTEWIDARVTENQNRTLIYQWLADATGVSAQTISNVDRGMRLKTYARAKAISDATGGIVTVKELCE